MRVRCGFCSKHKAHILRGVLLRTVKTEMLIYVSPFLCNCYEKNWYNSQKENNQIISWYFFFVENNSCHNREENCTNIQHREKYCAVKLPGENCIEQIAKSESNSDTPLERMLRTLDNMILKPGNNMLILFLRRLFFPILHLILCGYHHQQGWIYYRHSGCLNNSIHNRECPILLILLSYHASSFHAILYYNDELYQIRRTTKFYQVVFVKSLYRFKIFP